MAIAARVRNHGVLFISGEMGRRDIGRRYVSMRSKLPYSFLRRGKLVPQLEQKYYRDLETTRTESGLEIMDASLGFKSSDIELAIDKTSADLILIDAAYRIKANQKVRDRFENMALVADDLKSFALRYKKAIVATTQLNRASVQKTSFGDDDVALSDVVGWNATNLFALKQNKENKDQNLMAIHPIKVREAENHRDPLLINWNMEKMDFSQDSSNILTDRKSSAAAPDDGNW
jgi:replicative DNA helicase